MVQPPSLYNITNFKKNKTSYITFYAIIVTEVIRIDSLKNINIQFGNSVRKFREARGYTQNDFAFESGISRAYYGRIERGEYNVTIKQAYKISTTLGIRLKDLFEDFPD